MSDVSRRGALLIAIWFFLIAGGGVKEQPHNHHPPIFADSLDTVTLIKPSVDDGSWSGPQLVYNLSTTDGHEIWPRADGHGTRSIATKPMKTNEAVLRTRLAATFCPKVRFPRTIRITDFEEIVEELDHAVAVDLLKPVETCRCWKI